VKETKDKVITEEVKIFYNYYIERIFENRTNEN